MLEGKAEKYQPLQQAGCLSPFNVTLQPHPFQPGSVECFPSLPARELLQGSLPVPVAAKGSPIAGSAAFILLVYAQDLKPIHSELL